MMQFIDTHTHLDGEEFGPDREEVMDRARKAGAKALFLPAIDLASSRNILSLCQQYPGFLFPMVGLHPEEVRADYQDVLAAMALLLSSNSGKDGGSSSQDEAGGILPIAIGEVGIDFYWSREFEQEQLASFEEQVRWSVETRLPLMIHCRKAQNELVHILKRYRDNLPGGVFHCFTGNEKEAAELLDFDRFVLGIGGVLTFKKSKLPETLAAAVPLNRIVLETDSPYMAPVPMRGQRNESSYIPYIIHRLAEVYHVSEEEIAEQTTCTAERIFDIKI